MSLINATHFFTMDAGRSSSPTAFRSQNLGKTGHVILIVSMSRHARYPEVYLASGLSSFSRAEQQGRTDSGLLLKYSGASRRIRMVFYRSLFSPSSKCW